MTGTFDVAEVGAGHPVRWGAEFGAVLNMLPNHAAVVDFGAGGRRILTAWQLSESLYDPTSETLKPGGVPPFTLRWFLASEAARATAIKKQERILEMRTGYRSGTPNLKQKGEPRRKYDSDVKMSHRRASVAEDANVDIETVRDWERRFDTGGVVDLLDGRSRARSVLSSIHEVWVEEAFNLIIMRIDEPKRDVRLLVQEVNRTVRGTGIHLPSDDLGARALRFIDGKMKLLSPNRRRVRSNALSRGAGIDGVHGLRLPVCPWELLELDTNYIDVRTYDPETNSVGNSELTVGLENDSRAVRGLTLVPTTRAHDIGSVLFEVMVPHRGGAEELPYGGVPSALFVNPETWKGTSEPPKRQRTDLMERSTGVYGIRPDALVMDHGKPYMSNYVRGLCNKLHISIKAANIRSPHQKGHVEHFFDELDNFLQTLPGYKGQFVSERGLEPDMSTMLTIGELEDLIRRWIREVYHEAIHEGISRPDMPKVQWSPRRYMEAQQLAWGQARLPSSTKLAWQFMPEYSRTVQDYGVEISGYIYNGAALNEFRLRPNPNPNGEDPFFHIFRRHPSDIGHIYFEHPTTHEIIKLDWVHKRHLHKQSFSEDFARIAINKFKDARPPLPRWQMLNQLVESIQRGDPVDRRQVRANQREQAYPNSYVAAVDSIALETPALDPETDLDFRSDDDNPDEATTAYERAGVDLDVLALRPAEDL